MSYQNSSLYVNKMFIEFSLSDIKDMVLIPFIRVVKGKICILSLALFGLKNFSKQLKCSDKSDNMMRNK